MKPGKTTLSSRSATRAVKGFFVESPRAFGLDWEALASTRWTVVDHFERDGRRYILAEEHEHGSGSAAPKLSARERQVLTNAALGHSNKEIAHALGLADSTVRVLLTRAARKLRAASRLQLVERFDALARHAPSG